MSDSAIFRAILIAQLLDMLKPIVMVAATMLLFYGAIHLLRKRLERVPEPAQGTLEPETESDPLVGDINFQRWYVGLLFQGCSFTYDEAKSLYRLVEHQDLHSEDETAIARQDDGQG